MSQADCGFKPNTTLLGQEYARNEAGLILFPRDEQYRRQMFPARVFKHPAKANLYMLQAIAEYVSVPGQTILDPFGGTGSMMVAALIGRKVIMIELEDTFCELINEGMATLEEFAEGITSQVMLIQGNCLKVMPVPVDHLIFSPPYAQALMKKGKVDKFTAETLGEEIKDYTLSKDNIGNLNDFIYNHTMERVYEKAYECVPEGGTMTVIIKDRIRGGKRVGLIDWLIRCCSGIGWKLHKVYEWLPPGTAYVSIMRARGQTVVDEECLVIFYK